MRAGITETHFPFLARLTAVGRRELGALAPARVKPVQHLLQRGDAAGGAYLVTGGSLRVFYVTADGREATLYHVEPGGAGELFGLPEAGNVIGFRVEELEGGEAREEPHDSEAGEIGAPIFELVSA